MATFEEQVEGLTGLTIGSSSTVPTQSQLSDFLTDGAKDVICRLSKLDSFKMPLFSMSSTDSDNSGVEVDSGIVINVVRADGTSASNLYPAAAISSDLKYKATDSNSLHYRSKFNPGYYIENGSVFVVPAPSNSTTNKAVVTYVSYPTIAYNASKIGSTHKIHTDVTATADDPSQFTTSDTNTFVNGDIVKLSSFTQMTEVNGMIGTVEGVSSNNFNIKGVSADPVETSIDPDLGGTVETITTGFPDEYIYLVVLYAAIKSLEAKMGEYTITEEDAELVQAISASITTFKQQYEGAFAIMNPQVQQGAR